jgi:hypothetical protein
MVYRCLLQCRVDRKRERRTRSASVAWKSDAATRDRRSTAAHADDLPSAETQAAARKNAPCAAD